ncbi:MAG: hypothetical protein ACR2P5_04745 [Gammaproteobacteria bacterium]
MDEIPERLGSQVVPDAPEDPLAAFSDPGILQSATQLQRLCQALIHAHSVLESGEKLRRAIGPLRAQEQNLRREVDTLLEQRERARSETDEILAENQRLQGSAQAEAVSAATEAFEARQSALVKEREGELEALDGQIHEQTQVFDSLVKQCAVAEEDVRQMDGLVHDLKAARDHYLAEIKEGS